MGRGRGKLVGVACEAPRRGAAVQRDTVIDRLGFGSLLSSRAGRAASSDKVVRPLAGRSFVSDLEVWKQQEHEFIEGARAELEAGMRDFARSGQWGAFLRMATQSPEYSMMNSLWARGQMRAKWERLVERGEADAGEFGDPETGRFFSASAAKALGARIRDEYYHRPSSADYDDRFTVEMCKPLGFNGYWAERTVTDAAGRPVIDPRTGTPRKRKEFIKTSAKGYGTFEAYHIRALVDAEGQPFGLPDMPWENATGSDSDAATLIRDLERVCDEEGLALQRREIPAPANTPHVDAAHLSAAAPEHARYDREGRTITVDVSQPAPEQAVALLRALCEHVGYDSPPRDELEGKIRRAAAESAKYAVASLYGLAAQDQTFPYLLELADDEKAIGRLASDTHRRIQMLLYHLDPVMRAKARAEGERKAKAPRKSSRRRAAA